MLPKRQRLSRREFECLLRRGTRLHSEHVSVIYLPADAFKAGVVVSKKVARLATKRSHLRRQLYVALTVAQTRNVHIVALAKKGAGTLAFTDVLDEVHRLITTITTSNT
jgi:ribonuclease P protein component